MGALRRVKWFQTLGNGGKGHRNLLRDDLNFEFKNRTGMNSRT